MADGEAVELSTKELGACEVYPQSLQHNANGRFVVVCGDGEYIIYTSQVSDVTPLIPLLLEL